MNKKLTISDELIAQYAENNVSDEERRLVLNYLNENPQDLERVLVLTSSLLLSADSGEKAQIIPNQQSLGIENDIVYSAAAFAPITEVNNSTTKPQIKAKVRLSEIWDRLETLSDELKTR